VTVSGSPDPTERQAAQVVVGVVVLLVTVGIDALAEVALAIQEPDADRGQGHVTGGLHVVAGEHAQAARIDAERLVEAVLGAEIRERTTQLVGVATLEPVPRPVRHVRIELGEHVVILGEELRVIEQSGPLGRTADDRDRVAITGPRGPVDEVEQPAGARVPRPVEVVRKPPQAFESRREGKAGRRDRRDADRVHERP